MLQLQEETYHLDWEEGMKQGCHLTTCGTITPGTAMQKRLTLAASEEQRELEKQE